MRLCVALISGVAVDAVADAAVDAAVDVLADAVDVAAVDAEIK